MRLAAFLIGLAACATLGCSALDVVPTGGEETPDTRTPHWRQFGRDAQHTGRSTGTVSAQAAVTWCRDLVGSGLAEPVLDGQGSLFVASGDAVRSLDVADGALRWKLDVPPNSLVGIAISMDAELVLTIGGAQSHVRFVSYAGEVLRELPLDPFYFPSRPLIGDEGNIYVAAHAAGGPPLLYVVSPSGELIRVVELETSSRIVGPPAQDLEGNVLVPLGSADPALVKVDPNGTVLWRRAFIYESGQWVGTPHVSVRHDGLAIVTIPQGVVYGLDADGSEVFAADLRAVIYGPAALHARGAALVGHAWGVSELSLDGDEQWRRGPATSADAKAIRRPIAMSCDGVVVAADELNQLAAFASGTVPWRIGLGGSSPIVTAGMAISDDGQIYVGVSPNRLCAVR